MSREVTISLPGRLVWDLMGLAEKRGVSVAELIRAAVFDPPKPKPKPKPKPDVEPVVAPPNPAQLVRLAIRDYVLDGLDDAAIAATIGRSNGWVAQVRRSYGLPPNRRRFHAPG